MEKETTGQESAV